MLLRRIKGIRVSLRGLVIILGLVVPCATAYAQTDYSAGKTAAQLFSGDCSVCHKTTRGLVKTRDPRALTSFLREHYTSKAESAGALAAYLLGNPAAPADPEARKRQGTQGGTPGATPAATPGQATPGEEGAAPTPRQAARGRKPTPAELAREKEAAAKAAEEAAKAKLRGYASTGEAARPLVTEAPPAAVTRPPAEPAPAATAEPATSPAAEAPKADAPKPEVGTAPAATSPPAAERPASTPPG